MSQRYTVDLESLHDFANRLARFNARAEEISGAVDRSVAELQATWLGKAAAAHLQYHDRWMAAVAEMRKAVEELRANANLAHRNYSGVVQHNIAMWPA
jgi:WXG100 family type VII secretion target